MSRQLPPFVTVNGINRLAINKVIPSGNAQVPPSTEPLEENTYTFTDIASAINIGLEILESTPGRAALVKLATEIIRDWNRSGRHRFGGDDRRLHEYVDHFLSALRRDFPLVSIENMGNIDALASAQRLFATGPGAWDGNLGNYKPKGATTLCFNNHRVSHMVKATSKMYVDGPDRLNWVRLHIDFQFIFGIASAHELCHSFVGYISQNIVESGYTPPRITHLNYAIESSSGESGRWFENYLFGGTLELYRDPRKPADHSGIPYMLDKNDDAWQIDPRYIRSMIEMGRNQTSRVFRFPYQCTGSPLNRQMRRNMRLESMGRSDPTTPPPPGMAYMRAHPHTYLFYNIPREELNQVVSNHPRPLHGTRVR